MATRPIARPHAPISDLRPATKLTGLKVLNVHGTAVTDLSPLVSMPAHTRNKSSVSLGSAMQGSGGGGGGGTPSQCRLYSTSIQGRPNVIAQNCPGLAPIRVWRPLAR